ncbi:MAG: VOC family protein [Elusimicrobia bacterium]|nr:VOC family protein [Elusimicrobiota bacterium]
MTQTVAGIRGFYNVIIKALDVEKVARFYSGVLGLPVHHDCPDCVVLNLGQDQWLVIHKDRKDIEDLKGAGGASASRCGFGFRVDDVDALYERLKDKVKFPKPPADEEWGARCVTGFDPEDNKIEFIQEKRKP